MITSALNALTGLLKSGQRTTGSSKAPEGRRLYAFGDVHGRADLLAILLDGIRQDLNSPDRSWDTCDIIGLGDYLDRGPQSKQALDLLINPALPPGCQLIPLRGNHEDAFLRVIDSPAALPMWLDFGGTATLVSYGVPLIPGTPTPERCRQMHTALLEKLPADHLTFLRAMPVSLRRGDYFFVHAGIRPGRPLEEQTPEDMLWIREEFLSSRRSHGALIVHGHNITPQPDLQTNRIGLDTGAYGTGTLTCLVAEADSRWLLQADLRGIRKTALPPR